MAEEHVDWTFGGTWPYAPRWLRDFPHAEVLRLDDAGHYLQDDAHERIVPALLSFLRRN